MLSHEIIPGYKTVSFRRASKELLASLLALLKWTVLEPVIISWLNINVVFIHLKREGKGVRVKTYFNLNTIHSIYVGNFITNQLNGLLDSIHIDYLLKQCSGQDHQYIRDVPQSVSV